MTKIPYKKPELVIHGDITDITKGIGEGSADAQTGDSALPPPP